jgi:hypothetical protein
MGQTSRLERTTAVPSRWLRFVALALFAPLSALTSGCYKTVTLRPDQIPRLSGMARPQALSAGRDSTVLLEDRTTIITADGTTDEVRGQADVTITLLDGQVLAFDAPVQSSQLSPEELLIAGSNIPERHLRLDQIREATATYGDIGLTLVALLLTIVGIMGGTTLLVLAFTN